MGSPVAPPTPSPAADPGEAARGRRLHYGEFYGLRPLPPDDGRPLVVVHGNCQAESLRVLLAGSMRSVRMPPVHELERSDLPHLRRTLAHASGLVSQPVRPDYRELPLGTAQVTAALPPGAQTVLFPVMRYAGLFPFQAIVRSPVGDPPVAPFPGAQLHQRLLGDRAVGRRTGGADAAHTVNHPGNTVLRGLAERVLARLGRPDRARRHGPGGPAALVRRASRGRRRGTGASRRDVAAARPHLSRRRERGPGGDVARTPVPCPSDDPMTRVR